MLIPQICAKALQQKDANVYRVIDFVLELTNPTLLFLGQKHNHIMIDKRTESQFYNLKKNFDDPLLVHEIFKLRPKV